MRLDDELAAWRGADKQAAAERMRREDLSRVLAMPEGQRVMARTLTALGLGAPLSERGLAAHNAALGLYEEMAEANPPAAMNILASCFGLLPEAVEE